MKNKGYLCFEYEMVKKLVLRWIDLFEKETSSEEIQLDSEGIINRNNILEKLKMYQ